MFFVEFHKDFNIFYIIYQANYTNVLILFLDHQYNIKEYLFICFGPQILNPQVCCIYTNLSSVPAVVKKKKERILKRKLM